MIGAASNMPAAEVEVDEALVRRLLTSQHPDLADLPVRVVANGWDNAVVRLGHHLAVRLPRRAAAAPLVEHELRWLPELATRLPLPVPEPVRAGTSDDGYPFPWSVCRWIEGRTGLEHPPVDAAVALGEFVAALADPAPVDAPRNPFRGVPLADRVERFEQHLPAADGRFDVGAIRARWEAALATPPHGGPDRWIHGDLHPGNLVVDAEGHLAGVIDFGDLASGDPATDLAVAWTVFDPDDRSRFRGAAGAGADDATWARGRGWALAFALAYLANSVDNPPYDALGSRTITAILADTRP